MRQQDKDRDAFDAWFNSTPLLTISYQKCWQAACDHYASRLAEIAAKSDAEMERVKACEHIAEGNEGWEKLRDICPSTMAVAALRGQLAKEEKAHLQTIDERDSAQEALSQAYYLITGRSPEWSNHFGCAEALEEIDHAQTLLRKGIDASELTEEDASHVISTVISKHVESDDVAFYDDVTVQILEAIRAAGVRFKEET